MEGGGTNMMSVINVCKGKTPLSSWRSAPTPSGHNYYPWSLNSCSAYQSAKVKASFDHTHYRGV